MATRIDKWLAGFELDRHLLEHMTVVFELLPTPVRDDLMGDGSFCICDYEPAPDAVIRVQLGVPSIGRGSRAVVFKRTLRRASPAFVRYVIAHELAHAHLRNEGRFDGEDPEDAADALAANWGFPRPPRTL